MESEERRLLPNLGAGEDWACLSPDGLQLALVVLGTATKFLGVLWCIYVTRLPPKSLIRAIKYLHVSARI